MVLKNYNEKDFLLSSPLARSAKAVLIVLHYGEILLLGISSGLKRKWAKKGFWTCHLGVSGNLTHAIYGKMPGIWTFSGCLEAPVWEKSYLPFSQYINFCSSPSCVQGYNHWNTCQIFQLAASSSPRFSQKDSVKPIGGPSSYTQYIMWVGILTPQKITLLNDRSFRAIRDEKRETTVNIFFHINSSKLVKFPWWISQWNLGSWEWVWHWRLMVGEGCVIGRYK